VWIGLSGLAAWAAYNATDPFVIVLCGAAGVAVLIAGFATLANRG
jgi:hypothetical protein